MEMSMNQKILELRRKAGLTQEQLAQKLNISFQAVSKWENAQACPDIGLLPQIADLFGVSIDELFGREAQPIPALPAGEEGAEGEEKPGREPVRVINSLPWEDDGGLHIVVYRGHHLMGDKEVASLAKKDEPLGVIRYTGDALSVHCSLNLVCEREVQGNASAGGSLTVGEDVRGDATAGGSVNVGGDVAGNTSAGGSVTIGGDVSGSAQAGGSVKVEGDVGDYARAGGSVNIGGDVSGDVECGGGIRISGDVTGNVTAKGAGVTCGDVSGSVTAGVNITCGDVDGGSVTAGGDIYCDTLEDCTVRCEGTVRRGAPEDKLEKRGHVDLGEVIRAATQFAHNFNRGYDQPGQPVEIHIKAEEEAPADRPPEEDGDGFELK